MSVSRGQHNPLYPLAKLYIEQRDNVKALAMCRKVIDFQPKVHSLAVIEIKEEIEKIIKTSLNVMYLLTAH